MFTFYKNAKVRFNYLLDRIIDTADMILMDAYSLPWPISRDVAHLMARHIGDLSLLLRDFPRITAYKLVGSGWTIIFVGGAEGVREVQHLFFPEEEVVPHEIGRIAVWQLQVKTEQWLTEVDLVISELSRIQLWRPHAAITFTVPTWIQQVIDLVEPVEKIIAGRKRNHLRHRINRLQREGFTYCFSQSLEDFNHFYHQMYVPFIQNRHDSAALIASYEEQRQRWFERGGLVLVTQNDKALAGSLCYLAGETCFTTITGVLEADPHLFQQGVNIMRVWNAITWGHSQGAKIFDMGGSHAWSSNGSFSFKRGWGARIVRRKRIFATWTFLAQQLSPELQAYINKLGFLTEINNKFYAVLLDNQPAAEIKSKVEQAQEYGLAGLALVLPTMETVVYDTVN